MSSAPLEHPQVPEHQKKRKLALTKCDRCRQDKQKCTPVEPPRVWPAKCDRCLEKNFPCSEGRRVQRKSKHNVPKPTHQTILAEPSTSTDMENLLRSRESLINCQRMMDMALDHLKYFRTELVHPFVDDNHKQIDFSASLLGSEDRKLDIFCGALKDKISEITETITIGAINSGGFSGTKIIQDLIEQTKLNLSGQSMCPFCDISEAITQVQYVPKTKTVSSEALYRLSRLMEHINNPTHWSHGSEFYEELHIIFALMDQIKTEFESAVSDVGLIGFLPFITRRNLVFVPDNAFREISTWKELGIDCLGRGDLQRWLVTVPEDDMGILMDYIKDPIDPGANHQDILGRTALHIACQKGWTDIVEILMKNNAMADLRTIYGTLPLHYAIHHESLKPKTVVKLYKLTSSHTLDHSDNAGNDPLMYLIRLGSEKRLAELVKAGYGVLSTHIKKAIKMKKPGMLRRFLPGFDSTYEELCNSLLDGDPV